MIDSISSSSSRLHWAAVRSVGALAVALASLAFAPAIAGAQLQTTDLTAGPTPEDLASELAGAGVTVSNVSYQGAERAGGLFEGGQGIIGFEDGVILSSGDIAHVVGPNEQDGITAENGTPGTTELDELSGFPTFDASVLEFDFVPNRSSITFRYVFSSDEYNEFVHSVFNDVFAFSVNGENCATVGGDPVSINTINNGNPHGTEPMENPELYRNNDLDDGGGDIDTEMDGLTLVLTCEAAVTANATNHMRLSIADASDQILDSNVFLQSESLTTEPPDCGEDGLQTLHPNGGDDALASGLVHNRLRPLLGGINPSLEDTTHEINCDLVVPLEDLVDGAVEELQGETQSLIDSR